MCSAQKTPAFVRACRFACAATRRAGPCAPARRPKPKKGGASGTIGAPGAKKQGPPAGRGPKPPGRLFVLAYLTATTTLSAALPPPVPLWRRKRAAGPGLCAPCRLPRGQARSRKSAHSKTPGPGCRGWGFFFRQAGARLLCFPLCAVLHKKAKPTLPSAPNQNLPLWQVGALPWVSCSLLPQQREVCNPSTDTGLPMIG